MPARASGRTSAKGQSDTVLGYRAIRGLGNGKAGKRRRQAEPEVLTVETPGGLLEVRVKRHAAARRLILRLAAGTGEPVLTVPRRARRSDMERFVRAQCDWIANQQAKKPTVSHAAPGEQVIFQDRPLRLEADEMARGAPRMSKSDGGAAVLLVPGDPDLFEKKVRNWMKRQARQALEARVAAHAGQLGVRPARISVRDTRSRWGSCSAGRVLSFSWRLILAPPHVLDYVAAHEVAHLLEMNHGPAFWAHVAGLRPDYRSAQAWLKTYGAGLHAIMPLEATG